MMYLHLCLITVWLHSNAPLLDRCHGGWYANQLGRRAFKKQAGRRVTGAGWLFVSVWPCHKHPACPGSKVTKRQLGMTPTAPPFASRNDTQFDSVIIQPSTIILFQDLTGQEKAKPCPSVCCPIRGWTADKCYCDKALAVFTSSLFTMSEVNQKLLIMYEINQY